MEELIKKIEQWGYEKNIHLASPLLQTTKSDEECIELKQAIIRCEELKQEFFNVNTSLTVEEYINKMNKYKEEIKDAIGDIFVTLVMLSIQNKDLEIDYGSEDYTCLGYQEEVFIISSYISDMQLSINYNERVQYHINRIINSLRYIAKGYDFTLEECVKYAYNEIKDRKGGMKNGLWVKE